jgi:hypothetical protein
VSLTLANPRASPSQLTYPQALDNFSRQGSAIMIAQMKELRMIPVAKHCESKQELHERDYQDRAHR